MLQGLLAFKHIGERFIASAKAGTWLSSFRRRVVFRADIIEQDGVGLLMPDEHHSLGLWFLPAALVVMTTCAMWGFYYG